MKLRGIKDIIEFLNHLESEKIFYKIEKLRSEAVMVTYHLIGERVELEFFDDHIEYSIFSGDESVEDNQEWIFRRIIENR